MGSKIEITGVELIEIGKLMSEYGRLLQEAGASVVSTSQEGAQTIHVGIKATRRLVQKLLGQLVLPDDSKVDAVLFEKVVQSGISSNYSVENGRKMTAKELRQREAVIQYEKDARGAQPAKRVAENNPEFPIQLVTSEPQKSRPKASRKKKA